MAILKADELDIMSHSAEQTQRLGARLGRLLKPGDVVCLSGEMGAGKTMFASGIGRGWGATIPLTSPTYNLVHEHRRPADDQRLFHMDCYRIKNVDDAETVGLDDILDGKGIVIFEWPERIDDILPVNRLWIEFKSMEPTRRNFVFDGVGERAKELIEQFRESTFGV